MYTCTHRHYDLSRHAKTRAGSMVTTTQTGLLPDVVDIGIVS